MKSSGLSSFKAKLAKRPAVKSPGALAAIGKKPKKAPDLDKDGM